MPLLHGTASPHVPRRPRHGLHRPRPGRDAPPRRLCVAGRVVAAGRQAALRAEGQERHLAVHERRRLATWRASTRSRCSTSTPARRSPRRRSPTCRIPEKLKLARVVVINDANGQQRNKLYPLQVGFQKYGQSGIEVSDWLPHIGECIDDLAVVRSMWTTDDNHGAQTQFHSGRHMLDGEFPTLGAWVHYGLGSLNDNLPQFISHGQPRILERARTATTSARRTTPCRCASIPPTRSTSASPKARRRPAEQQIGFDLVGRLNRLQAVEYPDDPALAARIKSYELAFRMQTSVPEVLDFADETAATQEALRPRRAGDAATSACSCSPRGGSSSAACASSRSSTAPAAPAPGTRTAA